MQGRACLVWLWPHILATCLYSPRPHLRQLSRVPAATPAAGREIEFRIKLGFGAQKTLVPVSKRHRMGQRGIPTDFPFSKCNPDTPTQYTHQAPGPSPIGTHTSDPLLEPNSNNLDGRQRDRLQAGGLWFSGHCWARLQGSLCCGLCPRGTATLPPPGSLTSVRPGGSPPLSLCPATRSWERPGGLP